MAKFILVVMCAIIAGVAAKPGLLAAPFAAPLAYTAPVAVAAPLAYANAPLDAAFASNRVDIRQNYNAAVLPVAASYAAPFTYAAAAPFATTFAAGPAVAPVAPVAPLKYTAASVLL